MRAAPTRVQTHPPASVSPETSKPAIPGFKEPPSGKRRTPPTPQTKAEPQQRSKPDENNQTPPRVGTHSPEDVEKDPLVKSVLDVFEGEIKRVHPKNN